MNLFSKENLSKLANTARKNWLLFVPVLLVLTVGYLIFSIADWFYIFYLKICNAFLFSINAVKRCVYGIYMFFVATAKSVGNGVSNLIANAKAVSDKKAALKQEKKQQKLALIMQKKAEKELEEKLIAKKMLEEKEHKLALRKQIEDEKALAAQLKAAKVLEEKQKAANIKAQNKQARKARNAQIKENAITARTQLLNQAVAYCEQKTQKRNDKKEELKAVALSLKNSKLSAKESDETASIIITQTKTV